MNVKQVLDGILICVFLMIVWGQSWYILQLKEHNIGVESCEFNCDSFCGLDIPEDSSLTMVYGTDDLYPDIFASHKESRTTGTFNSLTNRMQMINDGSVERKVEIVKHELAHYKYHNNFNNEDKKVIKRVYSLFCQDADEFYAYTVEHHGGFKWL